MKSSPFDFKRIALIAFGLVMVAAAFYALIKSGAGSVTRLYKELQTEHKEIKVIKENIATLKKVDIAVISKTDQVFFTMPDRSLVPLVVSNLKTESTDKFKIETVRSDSTTTQNASIEGLSLLYEGTVDEKEQIVEIVDSIQKYAPLTVVERMELKETGVNYKINLRLSTFWSELPTELPQLKEPVTELTEEETKLMDAVSQFKKPSSSTLNPQGPVDRPNPFI